MRLVICDLPQEQVKKLLEGKKDIELITCDEHAGTCIGCIDCWLLTPGRCVIRDSYRDMGAKLAACSQLLIISRCSYGGFSPSVKAILDRSLPYLDPDFRIKEGEMHHKMRYKNSIKIQVCFYGDAITKQEKKTAHGLLLANSLNLGAELEKVEFLSSMEGVGIQ